MDKVYCTLIGVIIGALINHFTSVRRDKLNRFEMAASKFRSQILDAVKDFYGTGTFEYSKEIYKIETTRPKIQMAAAEFRFFVNDKKAFDKVISDYDAYCSVGILQPDGIHIDLKKTDLECSQLKLKFKAKVDDILFFTTLSNENPTNIFTRFSRIFSETETRHFKKS